MITSPACTPKMGVGQNKSARVCQFWEMVDNARLRICIAHEEPNTFLQLSLKAEPWRFKKSCDFSVLVGFGAYL